MLYIGFILNCLFTIAYFFLTIHVVTSCYPNFNKHEVIAIIVVFGLFVGFSCSTYYLFNLFS